MDEYELLFHRVIQFAQNDMSVQAMVLFGSRARTDKQADGYSDYDILFFVDHIDRFFKTDDWLKGISDYYISFVEEAPAHGYARRVFFDDAMDMDFIFYNASDAEKVTQNPMIQSWYGRGYAVVVDKIGYRDMARTSQTQKNGEIELTAQYYHNLAQTFWFHAIWAMKKLLRGEIWTGKRCIDGYMKELLREMLEYRGAGRKGSQYDVWYSGRFFDTWAGPELLSGLNCAYGAYNRASLEAALAKTMELFSAAAQETGRLYGFLYPAGAEAYAFAQVEKLMHS